MLLSMKDENNNNNHGNINAAGTAHSSENFAGGSGENGVAIEA